MLEESEVLAEMIGIILGDGRIRYDLNKRHYQLDIILNYEDEKDYVIYVKNYLSSLFKIVPKTSRQINEDGTEGKGIYLTIYDKKLIELLFQCGLTSGNKVENQVSVPKWIFRKKSFIISCLKSLFDTDGSLFPVVKENSIKLNFKNGSFPLINNFKQMCESIGIKTSKISSYEEKSKRTGKFSTTYIVQIQAKDQVKNFIELINPMKWIYRKNKLLKLLDNPFEYKINIYSKDEVEDWILLYKELKSFKSVRNYLKLKNLPTPRSETIRLRFKTYFGEYYQDWLKSIKKNN